MSNTSMTKFSVPSTEEMAILRNICGIVSKSNRYKRMIEANGEEGILLLFLMAREFDMKPLVALNGGLNVIDGRVEMSACQMMIKIREAGHSVKVEFNNEDGGTCIITGKRRDNGDEYIARYSMNDAKRAGLLSKTGWMKYPKDMLQARTISRLTRFLFPDVMGGSVYSEGEIAESIEVDADYKKHATAPVQHKKELTIDVKQKEVAEPFELSKELIDSKNKIIKSNDDLTKYSSDEVLLEYITECARDRKVTVDQMQKTMLSRKDAFEERFVLWLMDRFYTMHQEEILKEEAIQ